MNMVILTKLGWRLLLKKEELWAMTLRKKYGLREEGPVVFRHRQRASQTWRGLEWASNLLHRGLRWKLVDGRRIRFWKDCWLDEQPLLQQVANSHAEIEEDVVVWDFWLDGRG